jgi:hypothetical protein
MTKLTIYGPLYIDITTIHYTENITLSKIFFIPYI